VAKARENLKDIFTLSTLWEQGYENSYFEIGLKPVVVSCLTNALAPPLIAPESCSTAQTDQPVFESALEGNFLLGVADFLW